MNAEIVEVAMRARDASRFLAGLSSERKNAILLDLAAEVERNAAEVLAANEMDMDAAAQGGLVSSKLKRLKLNESSLRQLAQGLKQVASLPDPVGTISDEKSVPSGLQVRRVRVPIGVICMIYEARPAVTLDAFALCLKAGNSCILKGGREAAKSNAALARIAKSVLLKNQLPESAIASISTSSRDDLKDLLKLKQHIDLVIPRGGEELIEFVTEHSSIPVIQHFRGVCHIFVDQSADLQRAVQVCVSAKVSAPATCNAAECVLVHHDIASVFLPMLWDAMKAAQVEIRAEPIAAGFMPGVSIADASDFGREFLDAIVAVKVVRNVDDAVGHIARYGSRHTEAILTRDAGSIEEFRKGVDASCVIVNASTRFNDGFQLGLGAEIGISTSKLHAYGPMGLEELTTRRFEVVGDYQTR